MKRTLISLYIPFLVCVFAFNSYGDEVTIGYLGGTYEDWRIRTGNSSVATFYTDQGLEKTSHGFWARDYKDGLATYRRAHDAYDNKDYETALPIWQELAAEGNASAQLALGILYFKGEGVSQDLNEAIRWFERAAISGNVQAMFNLGIAYWEGNGIPQSYTEAIEWWKKSAAAGQPQAQYNIGLAYYLGKGTEEDFDRALKWINQAAENGHTDAQQVLSVMEESSQSN